MTDEFTDLDASELLALLVKYHRKYEGEQDSRELTVSELAGDLIESIPQWREPKGCRELIEG
jgi:hypothetical protein